MTYEDLEFETIVRENERLIYYHIRNLHINDEEGEFFAEGLEALWKAYYSYDPSLGKFSTYISWKIRNALIDLIRKDSKYLDHQLSFIQQYIHSESFLTEDIVEDHYLWTNIKSMLTLPQWKWVYYFIIHDLSVEQIAAIEGVSKDAVKNWGRHARK